MFRARVKVLGTIPELDSLHATREAGELNNAIRASLLSLVLAVAAVPSANAAEFHFRFAGRGVNASTDACDGARGVCTTLTASTTDFSSNASPGNGGGCVSLEQYGVQIPSLPIVQGESCGLAVRVPASLNEGTVVGNIPGTFCVPAECTPVTIRISLQWQSTGEIIASEANQVFFLSGGSPVPPNFDHAFRCQLHELPLKFIGATVSGQIDGLSEPVLPSDFTHSAIWRQGASENGTDIGCLD
jgi:hypothetical protein